MLKPLIVAILVLLLLDQAKADDTQNLCEGAGLMAKAGALYREQGTSEDAMRAEIKRRSGGVVNVEIVATHYAEWGYHSSKTPAQAYHLAVADCLKEVTP